MIILLMRHAEAAGLGPGVTMDGDRPLTARGERQVALVAGALQERHVPVEQVLCSPLLRSVQTARLAAGLLGLPEPRRIDSLVPTGEMPDPERLLQELPAGGGVLLVGHQPDLGLLAGSWRRAETGFSTGSVSAFEWSGRGRPAFLWALSPGELEPSQ